MAGIAITRMELTAVELRRAAGRSKDARAARRMLAIALVLEGVDRATAAATCGMDRQTLRGEAGQETVRGTVFPANGMVERFNGRIEEVLQSHHFRSGEELETTLHRYVRLYNRQLPQSALGSRTPLQAMKDWHRLKPELFRKQPYYLTGCDNLGRPVIMVLRAAILYFAVVFAAAFGLGVVRVMLVAPQVGALTAVALEVPIVLALSWVVAGRILRRWPMPLPKRVAMGALAFVILMVAEGMLSGLLFGQSMRNFVGAMGTLPGALGLAGQIGFGVIPALRRYTNGLLV